MFTGSQAFESSRFWRTQDNGKPGISLLECLCAGHVSAYFACDIYREIILNLWYYWVRYKGKTTLTSL